MIALILNRSKFRMFRKFQDVPNNDLDIKKNHCWWQQLWLLERAFPFKSMAKNKNLNGEKKYVPINNDFWIPVQMGYQSSDEYWPILVFICTKKIFFFLIICMTYRVCSSTGSSISTLGIRRIAGITAIRVSSLASRILRIFWK